MAAVRVVNVDIKSHDLALVTVQCRDRNALDKAHARDEAIRAAAARGMSGKIGYSGVERYGWVPDGASEPLTEAEMMVPGAVTKDGGDWRAVLKLRAM